MAIELLPLPVPASANVEKLADFGREVKGVNPADFTPEEFKEIEQALYKVCLFCSVHFVNHGESYPSSTARCYSGMPKCLPHNNMR
jgi:hypothetical protein